MDGSDISDAAADQPPVDGSSPMCVGNTPTPIPPGTMVGHAVYPEFEPARVIAGFQTQGPHPVALETGVGFGCARMSDRTVWCWGSNPDGRLGRETTPNYGDFPAAPVPGLNNVQQLAVGYGHACALRDDQTVVCWGRNDSGQTGDGTRTDHIAWTMVEGLDQVQEIAAGPGNTCALRSDRSVWCWGWNAGRVILPIDPEQRVLRPTRVAGVEGTHHLLVANQQACVQRGSSVSCWGNLAERLAAVGSATSRVVEPCEVSGAVEISSGFNTLCGRYDYGRVRCITEDIYTGDETTPTRSGTFEIPTPLPATQITSGMFQSCAVLRDQSMVCWVLAMPEYTGELMFTQRVRLANVAQVDVGEFYGCALTRDHQVRCWYARDASSLSF